MLDHPKEGAWTVTHSRYVAAAAEAYLFKPTTIKKGNGLDIFILSATPWEALDWPLLVRSPERSKKFGLVREYQLHRDELRMEVYLDFVQLLPKENPGRDSVGPRSVLCITAGRKCMIAATVSEFCHFYCC
jgi:hypothetical protein